MLRMAQALAGRTLPSSARLPPPSLGLLRLGMHKAFRVMRVAPLVGCSNMSCYDVATLGSVSRLMRSRLRRVLLAYTLPLSLPLPNPKDRVNRCSVRYEVTGWTLSGAKVL